MKRHAFWGVLVVLGLLVPLALLLLSCGSGGGSGTSGTSGTSDGSGGSGTSGTLSVAITDAKPRLPEGTEHVYVTFDEVQVHKAGGDWVSLPLAQTPYTIDLLQFSDGKTTQLVPPVKLTSGKFTQVRIVVSEASLVIDGNTYPVEVPSGKLRTDQNFDFEVLGGGAVDLTVDFDLYKSIVVTGNHKYKLKPVLHIVETLEAATIQGSIPAAAFGSSTDPAIVTVWWDKDTSCSLDEDVDEIYTQVEVPKADLVANSSFEIFWLVPNEAYIVQIDVGGNTFFFTVPGPSGGVCQRLPPSAVFHLELATIQGTIPTAAFGATTQATVTVYVDTQPDCNLDGSDEQYTTPLQVPVTNPTFSIPVFPGEAYILKIDVNGNTFVYAVPGSSGGVCQELAPGAIFNLAPARIEGSIAAATFGSSDQASVTVYLDEDLSGTVTAGDLVYTTLPPVLKATPTFGVSVFPAQDYVVRVVAGSTTKDLPVSANQLPMGATFALNGGAPI